MQTELGSPDFWDRLRNDSSELSKELCSIDVVDLDTTLQQHPALRAWLGAAYESLRVREERMAFELRKARARAILNAHQAVDAVTNKPKTMAILEAEAELDETVEQFTKVLLDLQELRRSLHVICGSMEDRLQMLIQLAVKHRQEQKAYS